MKCTSCEAKKQDPQRKITLMQSYTCFLGVPIFFSEISLARSAFHVGLYDVKFIGATRPDDFRKKVQQVEKLVEVLVLICGAMYAM